MEREIVLMAIRMLQDQGLLGAEREHTGPNIAFSCPFPGNHGGKTFQRTPSFHIHVEKGMWHCFGCKAGSRSIYDLYSLLAKTSRDDAERMVGRPENILGALEASLGSLTQGDPEPFCKTAYPQTVPLDQALTARSYIEGRGVPRWVWERAGLTYYDGEFMPPTVDNKGRVPGHRVIFPIYHHGRLLGYSGRSLEAGVEMKYYRPIADIGLTVYNPFALSPTDTEEVYAVEGEISALVALREGLPTVGCWGSTMSVAQAAWLARFKKVRIMFDPDVPGVTGAAKALETFATLMNAMPVYLPTGMDPGDMPTGFGDQVRQAVAAADARTQGMPFEDLQRRLLESVRM